MKIITWRIFVSGISVYGPACTSDGMAADGTTFSKSIALILPPGPDPWTVF